MNEAVPIRLHGVMRN